MIVIHPEFELWGRIQCAYKFMHTLFTYFKIKAYNLHLIVTKFTLNLKILIWGLRSLGIWCSVIGQLVPSVLKEHTAVIIKVRTVQGSAVFLWNIGNHSQNDGGLYPRRHSAVRSSDLTFTVCIISCTEDWLMHL